MILQLSSPLPCQTMRDREHVCEREATVALLRTLETFDSANYTLHPICPRCIAALATAAGQAATPISEAISAATIKEVLSARLGIEGAEETLAALRAAGVDEETSHED